MPRPSGDLTPPPTHCRSGGKARRGPRSAEPDPLSAMCQARLRRSTPHPASSSGPTHRITALAPCGHRCPHSTQDYGGRCGPAHPIASLTVPASSTGNARTRGRAELPPASPGSGNCPRFSPIHRRTYRLLLRPPGRASGSPSLPPGAAAREGTRSARWLPGRWAPRYNGSRAAGGQAPRAGPAGGKGVGP